MRAENIHFRCVFDLCSEDASNQALWSEIPRVIRNWISKRVVPNETFWSRWFYIGGEWNYGRSRVKVAATPAPEGSSPEYWAVSFENPDKEFSARYWRTDIGVTRLTPDTYRVSLALVHYLAPGYIGELPAAPVPTAPSIIPMLLRHSGWVAKAGSQRLRGTPEILPTGDGKPWVERLMDANRKRAVIFVSRDSSGSFRVDPARLARLLAGVAVVVEPDDGVDQELQWLLPKPLRCWNGAVRVYFPEMTQSEDGARHRYFNAERIEQMTAQVAEDAIVEALARRAPIMSGVLTTVQDVAGKRREARIVELREVDESIGQLKEWVKLLEEENKSQAERERVFIAENAQLCDRLDLADAAAEEAAMWASNAQALTKQERTRALNAEDRVRQLERTRETLLNINLFPRDVTATVKLAERLYPDKIVFTERAIKSAQDAEINDSPGEMDKVWQCIQAMALVLHELYFPTDGSESEQANIPQQFKAKSGFELALTESSMTKHDTKLMKLRKGSYKGQEIDIAPHVKHGGDKKYLRVHFYPHPDERILVIDHCGDHLDTAGTRRRK